MDYVFCYLSYYGYKMAQTVMKGFWEEMARLREGPQSLSALASPRWWAWRKAEPGARPLYRGGGNLYGRCLHVDPRFAVPPGYVTEATQRAGIESQIRMAAEGKASGGASATGPARMQSLARDMQGIVDNGYLIIGSPTRSPSRSGSSRRRSTSASSC